MLDSMHNTKQKIPAVKQLAVSSTLMNETKQQYKLHKQLPSLQVLLHKTRLIMIPHCVWAQAHVYTNIYRCTQTLQQTVSQRNQDDSYIDDTHLHNCITSAEATPTCSSNRATSSSPLESLHPKIFCLHKLQRQTVNITFKLSSPVNVQHTRKIPCTETAQYIFHCICNFVVFTTRMLKFSHTDEERHICTRCGNSEHIFM